MHCNNSKSTRTNQVIFVQIWQTMVKQILFQDTVSYEMPNIFLALDKNLYKTIQPFTPFCLTFQFLQLQLIMNYAKSDWIEMNGIS